MLPSQQKQPNQHFQQMRSQKIHEIYLEIEKVEN